MPDIPGFGAITITLMEEPYVDFRCGPGGVPGRRGGGGASHVCLVFCSWVLVLVLVCTHTPPLLLFIHSCIHSLVD